ncbi:hypothetical protein [Symbiobacterium thermophilum]|uniref:hypothetical protein n=1 Tax=Symbiobacterium thermophilum TaxID=2734 RepID=UPI002357392F|nr:hypothetical protein [Symbiobacterium thermophilum]
MGEPRSDFFGYGNLSNLLTMQLRSGELYCAKQAPPDLREGGRPPPALRGQGH